MNTKRIAALATLSALISTMAPALAAGPAPAPITVKWNTQSVASLTVTTQASGSITHNAAGESIFYLGNGGTQSGCNGTTLTASAGTDASAAGTVNFGNVTPDSADFTDCLEVNAANAFATTNDSNGYSIAVSETGAPATYDTAANGSLLCLLPNGTFANNLAFTASARAAAVSIVSTTACPAGDFIVPATGSTPLLTTAAATAGTNLGTDYELVLGPNSTTGAALVTVTYTMTTL
jgi:hypothetical protein